MYPGGHVQSSAWYPGAWYPYGYFYNPYGWPASAYAPVVYYYPVYCPPSQPPSGTGTMPMLFPREIMVKSPATAEDGQDDWTWIGGGANAQLTLEYMAAEEATDASIAVSISQGATTDWEEKPIATGYHVKSDLPQVPPGTRVRVRVFHAAARLRWCELLECGQGKEGE